MNCAVRKQYTSWLQNSCSDLETVRHARRDMILGKGPIRIDGKPRGAAAVEFAIAAIVLFTVLFGILDLAIMGFVNLTMQHAVREGTRYAITGQTDLDPDEKHDRFNAVLQKIEQTSMGFFDRVVDPESDITISDVDGNSLGGFGDPGELIVIRLNCTWPLLTPLISPFFLNGKYNFTVGAAMRNEFFPQPEP